MNMKISGGVKEDGIVVGNAYDKYGSSNPIVRKIMAGFEGALTDLVSEANPSSIHEIGCGEGFWVLKWSADGFKAKGSDFSKKVIEIAKTNAKNQGISHEIFNVNSIYTLEAEKDRADLVVCCEVLEHLEQPEQGLEALQRITSNHLIVSVPREPIWCFLNLVRGKYISSFGNTPGHIQHWSKSGFIRMVSRYFDVVEIKQPLPWTMLLCKTKNSVAL